MSKLCPECRSRTESRDIPKADWIRLHCDNCGWTKYYDLPPEDRISSKYQQEMVYR